VNQTYKLLSYEFVLMRRVIYAWDYIEWGGAQIHFLALMKEAQKSFETVAVFPKGTDHQFLKFMDSAGIRYELFEGHLDAKPVADVFAKLRRHLARGRAEYAMLRKMEEVGIDLAVHTDILPGQSLLSLVWLCLRTDTFITLHNAQPPVSKWRWLLWKMKFGVISMFSNFHVFCTNEHSAHYYAQLFGKRVSEDIKITYDSVNPDEIESARNAAFDRRETLRKLGLPTDKSVVLAVGQFVDRKGRWTFLEAAKQVAKSDADIIFLWVTPTLPTVLDLQRINSYSLENVFFIVESRKIGSQRNDILKFFRVAEIFVLPSLIEGVPIALLEAMAIGLPCISTNVYGIPEAIIDEETGLLVEPSDPVLLARSITRLKEETGFRNRLADNGRRLAITKFDERVAARIAVQAYDSILREKRTLITSKEASAA